MDDLLAEFLTETGESLAELDLALVRLEQTQDDPATLSLIFRLVHTIKGTCGFLGLPRLEKLAHAGENVLGRVRDGALPVSAELIGTVLACLDRIRAILAMLESTGSEPDADDDALIARLDRAAAGETAQAPPPEPRHDEAAGEPTLQPGAPPRSQPTEPAAPESTLAGQSIRVSVDVLEELMTLVSELVLTRNQLLQLARARSHEDSEGFATPLQRLSQITSDLQEGVMKTRMQPIGHAWNKLPRLVRDLGHELHKKIDLVMHGQDTELDRQVLELIRDPLTHMVRNSADHGLEDPAERRAAGKPEAGRITLNAYHEGGHIIIEVGDDGRGLPVDRIHAKILSGGLASEAELAGMTDTQILGFIFRPGFSTASQVTAVSGRGVGMDVVKSNIERIGGTIDLRSTAGRGTVFTIKIPLTLAIVSALIVAAGGERFAIPQLNVMELVRAGGGADEPVIEQIDRTPVLRLRNRLLPLVHLDRVLGLAREPGSGATHVVVAQVGGESFGLIVERVFDTEEIVVKPVAPILRNITIFSGNTILGDGSVIMILDPSGVARSAGLCGADGHRAALDAGHGAVPGSGPESQSMLLFRAGGPEPKAVPLSLVARIEEIPAARIEQAGGKPVVQYRGRLMPLLSFDGGFGTPDANQTVLVFADGERAMGLMVDSIIDVIEGRVSVEMSGERPGLLGTAVIAGAATSIVDISFWLGQLEEDWFAAQSGEAGQGMRVLVVEPNSFLRDLIAPLLIAQGHLARAVATPADAIRLREAGEIFDAILGHQAANAPETLPAMLHEGSWCDVPVIALAPGAGPADIATSLAAGFTDHVSSLSQAALSASLARSRAGMFQQIAAE